MDASAVTVERRIMSRIIDADALMKDICDSLNQMTDIGIAVDGDWLWAKLNDAIDNAPTIEPEQQWIPVSELPNDNREVEVTCEVKRLDGKKYRYTCHASYVHRYSIESTGYNNWEECDEYNEEEDMYYALPGWYERVHNWDEYSYCVIEDHVLAWRELPEPYKGE